MLSLKSVKRHPVLSADVDESYSDVVIAGTTETVVATHRFLLGAVSPLLREVFNDIPRPDVCILIPEVSTDSVTLAINFLRSEELTLDEADYLQLLELLQLLGVDYVSRCHVVDNNSSAVENDSEPLRSSPRETVYADNGKREEFDFVPTQRHNVNGVGRNRRGDYTPLISNNKPLVKPEPTDGERNENFSIDKQLPSQTFADSPSNSDYVQPSFDRNANGLGRNKRGDNAPVSSYNRPVVKPEPSRDEYLQNSFPGNDDRQYSSQAFNVCSSFGSDHNRPSSLAASPVSELMHSCHLCEKCFSSAEHLCKHVKFKHNSGTLRCDRCEFSTNFKTSLIKHQNNVHEKILNYECDVCYRRFGEKSKVKRHKDIVHLKVKAFPCDYCGTAFSVKDNLERHVRTHTGERPFCCAKCGKAFISIASLNGHKCLA